MKHLPTLPQALTLGLLSLALATPLSVSAKTKNTPNPLQCERDGRLQACEDSPSEARKPKKAVAFKAQATDGADSTDMPAKKSKKSKKKSKKAGQKKTKRASPAK